MSPKSETQKYTIKWLMQDKKKIKFNELTETYNLSDKVASYDLEKFGIKSGVLVDVALNGNEVVYLRKSETNQHQVSHKLEQTEDKEDKPENVEITQTFTIETFSKTKEVLKFTEDTTKKWYIIPENLQKLIEEQRINARDKVEVVIDFSLPKPTLKSIKKLLVLTSEATTSTNLPIKDVTVQNKSWNESKNDSIERQCAFKSACEAIANSCKGQVKLSETDLLTEKILKLAEAGIKFIQKN